MEDKGDIVGCSRLSIDQLNEIESFHLRHCAQARPEFKRVPVIVDGKQDFCVSIYIPYIGFLVETNKQEAWIRYGEGRHKMSDEEKIDFRSTRQELSFELRKADYSYPQDFDIRIIQDFCDAYRTRELKQEWTNEEVLIDRHLLCEVDGKLSPLNSFVLIASKDPSLTIPGAA